MSIPFSSPDICFIHAIFCHTGLPRSPGSHPLFFRSSGSAWLLLSTGESTAAPTDETVAEATGKRTGRRTENIPVPSLVTPPAAESPVSASPVAMPFGSLARLLLVWLSTATLRTGSDYLSLGPSVSWWLRDIGMTPDGRRYLALRQQLQALARSRLAIGFRQVEFDGQLLSISGPSRLPAKQGGRTTSLHIRLSPAYIHTLARHAVPLPWAAVRHLRGSALSLDVYFWLSIRLCRLRREPLFLSWEQLHTQFGMEYRTRDGSRLFRRELLRRLPDIRQVYPTARMETFSDGMLFFHSPPPVPSRRRTVAGKDAFI